MREIENGRIDSTMLGMEDHDIFTSMIQIKCENVSQGFGGWCLDTPCGAEFIMRTLQIAEARNWESLKGKPIRVKRETTGGRIIAIGHYIDDKWFNPETDLEGFSA